MKPVGRYFLIVGVLGALQSDAYGRDRSPLIAACPPPESFKQQIYNCGQNRVAVRFAENCSRELKTRAQERGKLLSSAMRALQGQLTNNQRNTMSDAMSRLESAIHSMEWQIIELQANTERASNYTDAMIDFPDGIDDASSAECFNESFHALQRIVSDLDQEIIQSKRAREEALALRAQLANNRRDLEGNQGSLNPLGSRTIVNRTATGPRRAPAGHGRTNGYESNVTGEENLNPTHSPGR